MDIWLLSLVLSAILIGWIVGRWMPFGKISTASGSFSLGIKQIEKDPFGSFISDNPKGSIVTGTVISVDAKAAVVDLGDGIEGLLRASEMANDRVEDARSFMNEGDQISIPPHRFPDRFQPPRKDA